LANASRDRDGWRCTLVDARTGNSTIATARVLVNAAGPWVSEILQHRLHVERKKTVRLVKGSHILVPRLYAGSHAFMLQNPDRRIVFVIPYEGRFSLIGTTEVAVPSPDSPETIDPDEIDYLCKSVNRYFARRISPDDVVWTYSGIRPLFEDAAKNATAVTRDYVLDLDAGHGLAPLLSIFGGKITTYRKLAERVLQQLAPFLPAAGTPWTGRTPLPGGDFPGSSFKDLVAGLQARFPFLTHDFAARLARAYGTRAPQILRDAASPHDLGTHFGADLYQVEIDYLIEHEWARTGDDVLLRRSKMILHLSHEEAERVREYVASKTRSVS
jgi:glycerol-3-phosphate dehydrogenase